MTPARPRGLVGVLFFMAFSRTLSVQSLGEERFLSVLGNAFGETAMTQLYGNYPAPKWSPHTGGPKSVPAPLPGWSPHTGLPQTFQGIPPFFQAPQAPSWILECDGQRIPVNGRPRLISRGKDGIFSAMIDHYGIVWSTATGDYVNPGDIVCDLTWPKQHRIITFAEFTEKCGAMFQPVEADSPGKVVARLNVFYKYPQSYNAIWMNCEHFARGMLTGVFKSTQVDTTVEVFQMVVKSFLEAAVQVHKQQLELQKRHEQERLARAAAHAVAAAASVPVAKPQPAQDLPAALVLPPLRGSARTRKTYRTKRAKARRLSRKRTI